MAVAQHLGSRATVFFPPGGISDPSWSAPLSGGSVGSSHPLSHSCLFCQNWLTLRSKVHENSKTFDVIKSVTKAIDLIMYDLISLTGCGGYYLDTGEPFRHRSFSFLGWVWTGTANKWHQSVPKEEDPPLFLMQKRGRKRMVMSERQEALCLWSELIDVQSSCWARCCLKEGSHHRGFACCFLPLGQ